MLHVELFEDIDEDVVVGTGSSGNESHDDSDLNGVAFCRHQ